MKKDEEGWFLILTLTYLSLVPPQEAGLPETNSEGKQILEAFWQNVLKKPTQENEEEAKWYKFKETDAVSRMLEQKVEEQRRTRASGVKKQEMPENHEEPTGGYQFNQGFPALFDVST